jgi:hypothetical protein
MIPGCDHAVLFRAHSESTGENRNLYCTFLRIFASVPGSAPSLAKLSGLQSFAYPFRPCKPGNITSAKATNPLHKYCKHLFSLSNYKIN